MLTGPEIQQGILREITARESLKNKFVAAVHLISDPFEPNSDLKIRAQVVLFDTEGAARAYAQGNPKPVGMDAKRETITEEIVAADTAPIAGVTHG